MSEPLGFMMGDISRLLRREFDARARRIGVTRAQWRTMSLLVRHPGCNQGMLADLLEVEPITVARMIDRLEEAGLAERRRDPADRRAWRIHLTKAAAPLLGQLRGIGDALTADSLAGLHSDQIASLEAMLTQIRANLTKDDTKEAANG